MKHLVIALLAGLALNACATPQKLYQAAAGPRSVGYSEYPVEPGRYRITFRGGPGATPQRVADLALIRAADLALAEGYDWFRVADRVTEEQPDRGPRIGLGVGSGSYGRRSGVSLGVGTSFDLGGGPSVSTTIEVLMGRGERPRGQDAYDARALRETLRALI